MLFGKGESGGLTDGFPNRSWDLFSYPFYQEMRGHTEIFSDVGALLSMTWTVHGTLNGTAPAPKRRSWMCNLSQALTFLYWVSMRSWGGPLPRQTT